MNDFIKYEQQAQEIQQQLYNELAEFRFNSKELNHIFVKNKHSIGSSPSDSQRLLHELLLINTRLRVLKQQTEDALVSIHSG